MNLGLSPNMANYYHTIIRIKEPPPFSAWESNGVPVAEVAFQTDDPNKHFSAVLDGLSELGVTKHAPGMAFHPSDFMPLADLPPGKIAEQPDWSNDRLKLWLISPSLRRVV